MARSSHHVVHNPNGGWDVKRSGAQRSSGHFATKEQAVNAGRQISRNQGTEFVIHGMNGRIQSADSHGNDPCPPQLSAPVETGKNPGQGNAAGDREEGGKSKK